MEDIGDFSIRPAEDTDVGSVRDLFVAAYGDKYPFSQFYDVGWLKKAVFDDDIVFLVAESEGRVFGTISTMFTPGNMSDLIGEFGRLVVHPDARGGSLGTKLFHAAFERVSGIINFGYAEARTAHDASQKILERSGFVPVGFEPLKYTLGERESMVMYGKLFGRTLELRRNHPRVIPEVAPLAMRVLHDMGLTPDVVVVEDDGYPAEQRGAEPMKGVEIEDLSEQGWSPLLRIERGRVRGREVFGNLSLSHGFFKIKTESTRYLVARQDGGIVGGLGFTHDPVDRKIRIFELIGINDSVKGQLLYRVECISREDLKALYIEADVNAYTPSIQRTLERMGFMAVAYCPSMVFENVERLDVLRMAKLSAPYFAGELPLTKPAAGMRALVERSMDDRRDGRVVAEAAGKTDLFRGLDEGDIYHLARIGRLRTVPGGEALALRGESGDRLYVVVSGGFRAVINGREVGRIGPCETAGEVALLDAGPRVADMIALEDSVVAEILKTDFMRVMDRRPRIGMAVMRNLAVDLALKIRRLDDRYTQE